MLTACAGTPLRPFPPRPPLVEDPDRTPFSPKPEPYESPFAWDGADQTVFRPITRFFAVDPAGEAVNVNALDEVPNSSWFTNRIGVRPMTPEEVARGPCTTPAIDAGPWKVVAAKPNGANPGFIIEAQDKRRYVIKFDGTVQGPRATTADVLGSKVYYAAGYTTPCNRIVLFHQAILETSPADRSAIDGILKKGVRLSDGRYRASASLFLEGEPLGPWTYQGERADDPNDVIDHEDRRDLRGLRVLGAWLNHFDAREQNTLSMWIESASGRGYVRHALIDFGDCLGSIWEPPMLGRRIGHAYYLDVPFVLEDFITFGLIERPWDRARFGPTGAVFGYFGVRDFDPEAWHPGYPNPAFGRMSERDAAWMARIVARFSDAQLRATIAETKLGDAFLEGELFGTLARRRDAILRRYLTRLSPLADPRLERSGAESRLCLTDLGAFSGISVGAVEYRASSSDGTELALSRHDAARICANLSKFATSTSPLEYLVVRFQSRSVSSTSASSIQGPLLVHLYHQGGANFELVGLERFERSERDSE